MQRGGHEREVMIALQVKSQTSEARGIPLDFPPCNDRESESGRLRILFFRLCCALGPQSYHQELLQARRIRLLAQLPRPRVVHASVVELVLGCRRDQN
jgi:hypothetical protein